MPSKTTRVFYFPCLTNNYFILNLLLLDIVFKHNLSFIVIIVSLNYLLWYFRTIHNSKWINWL